MMLPCGANRMLLVFMTIICSIQSQARFSDSADYLEWSGRIVGGKTAKPGQFPHQISLRESDGNHRCGGSIIHQYWIVTAAHCVVNTRPDEMYAVAGAHGFHDVGTKYDLAHVEAHDDFEYYSLENDIGIVRTAKPIAFTSIVWPIRITDEYVASSVNVIASGWGRNVGLASEMQSVMPTELQYIELVTISNMECMQRQSPEVLHLIHNSTLCVYSGRPNHGMCNGDSGGPLISADGILVGIVSWGVPCAKGFPDGFTRISSFMPWIGERLNQTLAPFLTSYTVSVTKTVIF